jgi:Holliday junction DNA helicase RuvA
MFEYLKGTIQKKTPTYLILESEKTGYLVHISLFTYSNIPDQGEIKIYVHQVIREDAHLLYGFISSAERELFRYLISVSGIGANTARMILSALTPDEVREAIQTGNVLALKGIKGIGAKTAQRLIVDLRDKVGKSSESGEFFDVSSNRIKEEALSALATLGFSKTAVNKILDEIISRQPDMSVEDLLREALKRL